MVFRKLAKCQLGRLPNLGQFFDQVQVEFDGLGAGGAVIDVRTEVGFELSGADPGKLDGCATGPKMTEAPTRCSVTQVAFVTEGRNGAALRRTSTG